MTLAEHAEQGHQLHERDQEQITAFVCVKYWRKWLGEQWEFFGPIPLERGKIAECAWDFVRDDFGRKRDFVAIVDPDGNALFRIERVFGEGYNFRAIEGEQDPDIKAAFQNWRAGNE